MDLVTPAIKSESSKVFFINTLLNFISRGAVIGINFILVPLLLHTLGTEKYGVWQTVLSVISLTSLLNFGLGNGLRNLITQLVAGNNHSQIGAAIGSTIQATSKIVLCACLIIIPLFLWFFKPDSFFVTNSVPDNEIIFSLIIFLFFFLINIVLGLSNSIAFGIQKSYLTGVIQGVYLLACYLVLFILGRFYEINLIDVAVIFGGLQSLCYLAFFIYQNKRYRLNIDFKSSYSLKSTYKLSGNFFFVQLLGLIYLTIDNFVISSSLGSSQTAEYSVVNRIFFTIIGIYSIFLIQFWNSVTEAKEKKEMLWIRRTLRLLFLGAICTFAVSLFISFYQEDILLFWLGADFARLASSTFYLFAFYTFFHCVNAIFINLQNGLGELKVQIISTLIALSIYVAGCFMIDIKTVGYNYLILLKVIGTLTAVFINSFVLKKITS